MKKKGVGDRNKNVIFFWDCDFYVFLLCNQKFERP
jgi:hypothetical protein